MTFANENLNLLSKSLTITGLSGQDIEAQKLPLYVIQDILSK